MRKFFQRLDNSSKNTAQADYQRENLAGNSCGIASGTHSGGSFIGKVFNIGQYNCTVEDIIAEGGFALVFLVKAQGNLCRFALKRLLVNSEQDLENAKNEIEIAKKLSPHKNIVNLVESRINYSGNGVYEIHLLMDYCKGHLLQKINDKLKDGARFNESEIIEIFCDLCEAIAKMHQFEPAIIHRDLKVENILINESGAYQLCDFGSATCRILCASSPDQSALEIEEEIKRYTTLSYRAPEMIDIYSGKAITTKADIWALGCCLFKLCFFQMPFGESTLAIQNAQLTIPDDKANDYSPKLLSLIAYMLIPDPEIRPDIFQVSQLAFKLAERNCPIVNVKAKVSVPDWTKLRVPPTESQAREIRKSISSHNLQIISNSNSVCNPISDPGIVIDQRTTSVTPRQRPKTSITLSSALPTSPVAFPVVGNTNRATTPCDLTSTVNTLTSVSSSSAPPQPSPAPNNSNNSTESQQSSMTITIPPPPSSSSAKIDSSKEYSVKISRDDSTIDGITPLNSTLSSTNPFLEDSERNFQQSSNIPSTQLSPAQSLRNLSLQQDISDFEHATGSTASSLHQHRRNLSDTSAFSQKNIFDELPRLNSYSLQSSVNITQQSSGTRSLNPFIDTPHCASFEDQLFGHEFDRIRQENSFHTTEISINGVSTSSSSTSAHVNSETVMAFRNNHHSFERKNVNSNATPNENSTSGIKIELQRPAAVASKPKQNTIIQITSGNAFVVQNDVNTLGQVIRPSPSSAFVAVVGAGTSGGGIPSSSAVTAPPVSSQIAEQMKHLSLAGPNEPSISSSSQGQEINLTQTANYMPLYSSEESENSSSESDFDSDLSDDTAAPIADSVHFGDDVLDNLIHESSTDLTKPLVDENDDDEYEEDDEDEDDDDDLSIGSASDLQHSSSESNNSSDNSDDYDSDDLNSSKSSLSRSDGSLSDSGKTKELNGFIVISHHHHHHSQNRNDENSVNLIKNSSNTKQTQQSSDQPHLPSLIKPSTFGNQLEISNVNTDGDGTSCSEILSTTSSMNLSAKVQDNTNVTIDQLIGHIDANRPLLEEDDDPEDDPDSSVRPMIEIDQEIEYIPQILPGQQIGSSVPGVVPLQVLDQPVTVSLDSILSNDSAPIDMFASMSSSTHSVIMTPGVVHTEFDIISSTDSEENRKLDEEVEMSLTKQVLMDQMNRKDLFGSVPFTDKELVDKSIEQQNKIALQKTLSLERTISNNMHDSIGIDKTDLFGAVPFNSTEKISKMPSQPPIKSIKLDPPPQTALIKHYTPSVSSASILTSSNPGTMSNKPTTVDATSVPNISSKPLAPSVSLNQENVHKFISQPHEPKSPIPSLKSVGKIKTKTARKYEVDESDEEVDGLLEPQDEESDVVLKKKKKKDVKKEKTDKKSKEKEVKKEKKNREKLKKVIEKELKKKTKSKVESKAQVKDEHLNTEQVCSGILESKGKLKVLKADKDKKKKGDAKLSTEFGIKVNEKENKNEDMRTSASELISSNLNSNELNKQIEDNRKTEKSSKKKKDKKEKEKKKSEKLKEGKKHQAFANMSFEDETASMTSHFHSMSSSLGERDGCNSLAKNITGVSSTSGGIGLPGGTVTIIGEEESVLKQNVTSVNACLTNPTTNVTITRC